MNTVELAVEHVLTGALALCAFVLPFAPPEWLALLDSNAGIVALVGACYLTGIIADRLADELLSPFEQRLRIAQAEKSLSPKHPVLLAGRALPSTKLPKQCDVERGPDPFPQDAIEDALRQENSGRLQWINSLRSRIRIARGVTVYSLPAALGISLFVISNQPWHLVIVATLALILVGGAMFLGTKCLALPRTDDLLYDHPESRRKCESIKARTFVRSVPLGLLVIGAVTGLLFLPFSGHSQASKYAIIAGSLLCFAAALWVWFRVTKTFMANLISMFQALERRA